MPVDITTQFKTIKVTVDNPTVQDITEAEGKFDPDETIPDSTWARPDGIVTDWQGNVVPRDQMVATDGWYQLLYCTDSVLTIAGNNYRRKSFLSGYGGSFSGIYAQTVQKKTNVAIDIPTPVPEPGFEFAHWVNYATGEIVDDPASVGNSSRDATIFAAIYRQIA